ncbi:DnaJ subfamily C member 14, partial [Orchesella cincta]
VPNLSQRKSIDYFMGAASTPSSSCPSSSSSPATKPRNLTSGTLLKGKENVSISAANNYIKQTARNSPSSSPAHVQSQLNKTKSQQGPMVGVERKVLSSQNSTSGGSKNTKGFKNGKVPSEKSIDVEEINEEGDWGWKTYTTRGRNNNLSSVGNKNSQKRSSNGHCSSEPAASSFSVMDDDDDDDDDSEARKSVIDEGSSERKSSSSTFGSTTSSSTVTSTTSHTRKPREKEKSRSRKEDRNCVSRRLENLAYTWLTHMISALTWLWTLITDVASLSASLGVSLMQDFYIWTKTKALPNFSDKITGWQRVVRHTCHDWWYSCRSKLLSLFSRGSSSKPPEDSGNSKPGIRHDENILSLLGPERNISLPANGDEALKRLLSVKGQDPYSILGVRSDSNEETIRRYYKRQAVLVHPDKNLIVGAEEAFKILARAFEMVGDPLKRAEYHQKLMEAQAKEKFCGEIGNLLEQLRKKMEAASSTIRCTKCNSRHKKNMTDRPLFAARYCSQCRIHHGAREGELERGGWWNIFGWICVEINEWARCQKTNLKHIKADAHCVMYRLVAGGNNQQNHNQHCHGTEGEDRFGAGSEADEWDSLINNLCKSSSGSTFGKTTGVPGKAGCCASGGMNANGSSSSSTNQAGKRRKGKRNK